MMQVTVLGCGGSAGVPMIGGADGHGDWGVCDPAEPRNRRTRSSIVLQGADGQRLLVDTSPDLRAQVLACGVGRIDAVLFTHAHADHILGLDELRAFNRIINRPLPAFATEATGAELRRRFDYVFTPWEPPMFYRPVLELEIVAPGQVVRAAGMELLVFAQDHGRVASLGFRVGGFAYCTDTRDFGEEAWAALAGVECWMVDCFGRTENTAGHAWLARVLEWHARLAPRRTVLTHLSADMDFGWLRANLPAGVSCAYDGMVLTVA